jgi:hypothetical protein
MKKVLVVANETLGGRKLLEKVQEKAQTDDDVRFHVVVPRTNPRHGNIIYEDSVFDAAQIRIDLARAVLREEGLDMIGEVGDPDPYTATMDAIGEHQPHEVIVSTLPVAVSGWMRRDLVERIRDASGLPVEHVVQDVDAEGLPFGVTLVVANRTAASDALLDTLRGRAQDDDRHLFICVVPQEGGDGLSARKARARLAQLVDRMRGGGLIAAGMVGDPDPYTAIMQALQFFRIGDVVISTLPATRSGWLRADLIERVRKASDKPVEHVVAEAGAAQATV